MTSRQEGTDLRPFRLRVLCGGSAGIAFPCGPESVLARSRVDAYLRLYRQFTSEGAPVTVAGVGAVRPLGFTDDEIQEVQDAGIPLIVALLPSGDNGRQIELIEE
jgi:hypothetical protein